MTTENTHTNSDSGQAQEKRGTDLLPEVTFSTFVLSLASSALVQLGEVPNPDSGRMEPSLPLARNTIDMLTMLEDKCTHGLSADETRLLRDVLYELRIKFVAQQN